MANLPRYVTTIPYGALEAYLEAGWQILSEGPLAVSVVIDVPDDLPADEIAELNTPDLRAAVDAALKEARHG
ncbi:MAG: hypothetical protein CMO30_24600 [Tistrella sp.]|uniref:Uncharacterized protein n=1 Tax=Tistrella mobilis TaxID=171437 RepID=A0A3B9IDE1_9PROT|nr:hypothetical protein [Tistrella sp.]MAD35467.1 hypothetical protein [Tistrella sp.]MBA78460.1 hypothetical protein [Tistrella sp.]HAE45835.1 hypothetical protein [Tistrella mobilis]